MPLAQYQCIAPLSSHFIRNIGVTLNTGYSLLFHLKCSTLTMPLKASYRPSTLEGNHVSEEAELCHMTSTTEEVTPKESVGIK